MVRVGGRQLCAAAVAWGPWACEWVLHSCMLQGAYLLCVYICQHAILHVLREGGSPRLILLASHMHVTGVVVFCRQGQSACIIP